MAQDGFLAALGRLSVDCPQVEGAVLATREGLVLVATGGLRGDVSAASAAHLADRVDQNLSLMSSTQCAELLIWASPSVWYLTRLADQCVLMVCSAQTCRAGALRLAGKNAARQLTLLLGQMG
ncbi:MAG: hypothetical protein Q7T46_03125 [Polaromonas sp.]|nr:hypothetical protein [Polaromonas sp.]